MRTFTLALLGTTALLVPAATAQTSPQQSSTQQSTSPAQQSESATNQTATQPLTASSLRNQAVFNQNGQEFGRVTSLMRGDNDQVFAVVTAAGNRQLLVPTERLAFENNRYVVRGDEEQLRGLTEYREGVGSYRLVQPNERLAIAGASGSQRAAAATNEGSQIVVQQSAPQIRVDQASPQVNVQQAQPQVTVRQSQPEVIVRQPAPTVTVDIPQPEITLRMPRPDVNVAQAQPQVEVHQPEAQVRVVQPQQPPQVQVERDEPQVDVQQSGNSQANVQIEGADQQPRVRYERAEPRIVFTEPKGEPQVRVERMEGEQQAQASDPQQAQASDTQRTAEQRRQARTEEQRQAYQRQFGGAGDTTATTGTSGANQRAFPVSAINDMDVYNAKGERLGGVDQVIASSADNKRFLVVAHGGFLGIGEDKVAFPLERFAVRGDRLVIRGVTEQDMDAMDNWRDEVASYRNLGDNDQVSLSIAQ